MDGRSETDDPCRPLAGRLEGTTPSELIWQLSERRATGLLRMSRNPAHPKLFYLEDGRVVFVSSADPDDRIGEMFLRHGNISLDQLEAVLKGGGREKRLGTRLVEAGSLTPDQLIQGVLDQIKAIVLDMLTWEHGRYEFEEGELPTEEAITLRMETAELLLEGFRRFRSFGRLRRLIGPPRTVYGLCEGHQRILEDLELTEGERLIVEQLGLGDQPVEALCRELLLSSFEIYQTLWAYRVLGVVREQPALSGAPIEEVPFEGRLERGGLAELLVRIGREERSGVLYLTRNNVARSLHFQTGRCVFATSNDPSDGLVSHLLRRGVISLADAEETARRTLSNKRVGTILRELGVIDDIDLREVVRQHMHEIACDTFGWEDADYFFAEGPLPSHEEITLDADVASLIAEGVRRVATWTSLVRGCGGLDNPLALTPIYLNLLDAMDAGTDEWAVVNALKSPQSLRRLCRRCEVEDFRAGQILWTLKLLGAVEPRAVEEEEIELPLDAAAVEAETAAEPEVEEPAVDGEPVEPLPPVGAPEEPAELPVATAGAEAETEAPADLTFRTDADAAAEPEVDLDDDDEASLELPGVPPVAEPPSTAIAAAAGVETPIEAATPPADTEPSLEAAAPEPDADEPAAVGDSKIEDRRADVEAALLELPEKSHFGQDADEVEVAEAPEAPAAEEELADGEETAAASEEVEPTEEPAVEEFRAEADTPAEDEAEAEGEPLDPDWELPGNLDEIIERFNSMHRVVYRAVRSEIGAGAVNFIRSCCGQVAEAGTDPLKDVQLLSDGSWDAEALRKVVREKQISDPWPAYQKVLDHEYLQLRPHMGETKAVELKRRIWELEQSASR